MHHVYDCLIGFNSVIAHVQVRFILGNAWIKNNKNQLLVFIITIVVASVFHSTLVEINNLIAEINSLNNENYSLKDKIQLMNDSLQLKNQKLTMQNQKLMEEIEYLIEQMQDLVEQNKHLTMEQDKRLGRTKQEVDGAKTKLD